MLTVNGDHAFRAEEVAHQAGADHDGQGGDEQVAEGMTVQTAGDVHIHALDVDDPAVIVNRARFDEDPRVRAVAIDRTGKRYGKLTVEAFAGLPQSPCLPRSPSSRAPLPPMLPANLRHPVGRSGPARPSSG